MPASVLPSTAPVIVRPLTRGALAWLGSTVLRIAGWKVVLAQPVPTRCVAIFYPHTSNWDTAIGLCAKFMLGIRVRFVGKDTLFRVPVLGPLLLRWGGIPVNRREPAGFVRHMQDEFARHDEFRLAIAPEGTRSRMPHWKSGFYRLARAAGVPLALAYADYPRREIGIGAYLDLTGDVAADMARIRAFYADKRGCRPANQSPVRLRDESDAQG